MPPGRVAIKVYLYGLMGRGDYDEAFILKFRKLSVTPSKQIAKVGGGYKSMLF